MDWLVQLLRFTIMVGRHVVRIVQRRFVVAPIRRTHPFWMVVGTMVPTVVVSIAHWVQLNIP